MIKAEDRKQILYLSFILILIINFLHLWAIGNYFYWVYWWFDILMHFLGGLWVGITFLWTYTIFFRDDLLNRKKIFLMSFIMILLTIISWEIFELFIQNDLSDPNFLSDTSSDMLLGMIGGSVAYRYFVFNFIENKIQNPESL
jgi:hypothetical protein